MNARDQQSIPSNNTRNPRDRIRGDVQGAVLHALNYFCIASKKIAEQQSVGLKEHTEKQFAGLKKHAEDTVLATLKKLGAVEKTICHRMDGLDQSLKATPRANEPARIMQRRNEAVSSKARVRVTKSPRKPTPTGRRNPARACNHSRGDKGQVH